MKELNKGRADIVGVICIGLKFIRGLSKRLDYFIGVEKDGKLLVDCFVDFCVGIGDAKAAVFTKVSYF